MGDDTPLFGIFDINYIITFIVTKYIRKTYVKTACGTFIIKKTYLRVIYVDLFTNQLTDHKLNKPQNVIIFKTIPNQNYVEICSIQQVTT